MCQSLLTGCSEGKISVKASNSLSSLIADYRTNLSGIELAFHDSAESGFDRDRSTIFVPTVAAIREAARVSDEKLMLDEAQRVEYASQEQISEGMRAVALALEAVLSDKMRSFLVSQYLQVYTSRTRRLLRLRSDCVDDPTQKPILDKTMAELWFLHKYARPQVQVPKEVGYVSVWGLENLSTFWLTALTHLECAIRGLELTTFLTSIEISDVEPLLPVLDQLKGVELPFDPTAPTSEVWNRVVVERIAQTGIEEIQGEREPSKRSASQPDTPVKTLMEACAVLQVRESATLTEVREVYVRMIKKYHPDNFGEDAEMGSLAEARTKQINQAYELLKRHLA